MNLSKFPISIVAVFLSICASAFADRIDIPAGFPNAENTGHSGELAVSSSIDVTTDGAIIENLRISGGVVIDADNVTVRNCHITGGLYGIQITSGHVGTLIEDCTIYDGTSKGIVGGNFTARRCDISMYSDCMFIGSNVVIEDCYLHDLKITEGSHNDGIQGTGNTNVTIRHNSILAQYQNQTSALIFQTQYGIIDNFLVENNFMSGGSYTVYFRNKDTGYGDPTNIHLVGNVFEYDSYASGPVSKDGDGLTYVNNIYHTGDPLYGNPVVDNRAPAAVAGGDVFVEDFDGDGFETVSLDGLASEDLDGTIVSYVWTDASSQVVATAAQAQLSLAIGVYELTLTVTDDDGDTGSDTVVIEISPELINQVPTAEAGEDQELIDTGAAQSVSLDGSASADSDGQIVSYIWSEAGQQIAEGVEVNVMLSGGLHEITLTVTDDDGASSSDIVVITIDIPRGILQDNVSSAPMAGGSSISWSHDIGAGMNRLLVVGIASEDGSAADLAVLGVTYAGVKMQAVENSMATSGAGTRTRTQLYYMLEADLPAAGCYDVVVTRAGANSYQSGGAVSLINVKQQPAEAVSAQNVLSSSITTPITTLTDGAWIVDVVGHGQGGSWTAVSDGQEKIWNSSNGSASHAGSVREIAVAGLTETSWSFGSSHLIAHSLAAFAPAEPLAGDADGNNTVDIFDFLRLKANFGTESNATWSMGDFDGDGDVDIFDFLILKANFGSSN